MTVATTLPRLRWTVNTGETYQLVLTRTAVASYTASGAAHTAAIYGGTAARLSATTGPAPASVPVSFGAAWNDASADRLVEAVLRDLGRAWGVYLVGSHHLLGQPPRYPITWPLNPATVALLSGSVPTWTGQRASGAASALRLLNPLELPGTITTYCPPLGGIMGAP